MPITHLPKAAARDIIRSHIATIRFLEEKISETNDYIVRARLLEAIQARKEVIRAARKLSQSKSVDPT